MDQPETPRQERVYLRDVEPYVAPDSLDQLRGPDGGVDELPHSVLWAPAAAAFTWTSPAGPPIRGGESKSRQEVRTLPAARRVTA